MTSSFTGSLFRSRVSVRSSCSLPSLLFLPFAAIFPPPPGPALKTDGMANDEEEGSAEEVMVWKTNMQFDIDVVQAAYLRRERPMATERSKKEELELSLNPRAW